MLWGKLNRDQRLAFYELLKVSAYSREGDNLEVLVINEGGKTTFDLRSKDSFYRNKIKDDRLDFHKIKFIRLLHQSRLLRYLLKHPTILTQWIINRTNENRNSLDYELDEVASAMHERIPLTGFSFDETPQGYDYWNDIYIEASKEQVRG